ncbi:MAG: hypothetical protein Devi2KO_33170 [Devosia indica]
MTDALILAIDQGTTNTKALLVDATGHVRHQASAPNIVTYPQPGWAEQSATALIEGIKQAIAEVLDKADGAAIAGIGISNQRESVRSGMRRPGHPLAPAWNGLPRRSSAFPRCCMSTEALAPQGSGSVNASRLEAARPHSVP